MSPTPAGAPASAGPPDPLRSRRPATRRAALALSALLAASGLAAASPAAAEDAPVRVTVNVRGGWETVSDTAVGVNHAIWDTELGSNQTADLLKDAGARLMRYPGGSYSDIYHWRDHTAPGGYVAPNTDFATFMAGVRRAGAQAIVTANYGTGTAQEAADWVRHANVEQDYAVKLWEIGNENYGNGHYGSPWEADDHADKSPAEYARHVVEYSRAMKAVDPSIKIGAVLTTPGEWPDGITAAGDAGPWNQVVLDIAGDDIDFVILHFYAGGGSAAEALARVDRMPVAIDLLHRQVREQVGRDLGVAVTEINMTQGMNTQPGALFAADVYAALIARGVFTVDWWNVRNGIGTIGEYAGQTDYGDWGLLSSGNCTADGATCQPALNTPFAPYYALGMVSRFARPGDQFVRAGASDPAVKAHAARRADGGLAVMLLNEDPAAAKQVSLSYAGYTPAASAQVLRYGNGDTAISTGTGTASSVTLPPYSITTLVLRPSAALSGPAAPGRPAASAITDRSATLTWPAAAGSGLKYEIHRQHGTVTEQWGETTGTTFTVGNLTPGTTYTANVIARDGSGRVSWASPPVLFSTVTPTTSTCAVAYNDDNDWGNGFVAGVDVVNTGTAPMDGWTLTFDWPTTWQQFGSGWNANWSQTGGTVKVTNVDWNRLIAPGASVNVGFVGNYQGPNPEPPRFTVNGMLCTTR
ncbi:cellulose binding domain-containing protein [Catellatospora bangladeshensis]|uniref:Alpha-L-arabinofuranosidase n=1 Tax=Catellatospora bangladeshensis TaxID=310355 RepID=A0A8J3JKB6_9ACTN|nr:cellulose binding domain-containing protein [Catellatospora bangladeshensis]GIF82268.1 alpha-L-arabinofuranosidase [Catellatospora bangladeshensis]